MPSTVESGQRSETALPLSVAIDHEGGSIALERKPTYLAGLSISATMQVSCISSQDHSSSTAPGTLRIHGFTDD